MKGTKRTTAALAAIALSAGVISGCGSSSDGGATSAAEQVESATTAALTQAEYVAKANAICTKIDDSLSSLDDQSDSDSLASAKEQLANASAAAEEGVAEMKALVPPADLQAAHDTLVQTSGDSIALMNKLVASAESAESGNADTAGLAADLEEAMALEKKQTAAAKDLGLSNCFTGDSSNDSGIDDADNADDGAND
jgi:hypothetical protein